jgi:hypothetical protein
MNEKCCPLYSAGRELLEYCLMNGCSWWMPEKEACAILELARRVDLPPRPPACGGGAEQGGGEEAEGAEDG